MYCEVLHFEFIQDGHIECPFCNKKLVETKSVQKRCCDNPDVINDTYKMCINCGTVSGHLIATEFVDFYENS